MRRILLLACLPYPQAATRPATLATVRRILAHECERAGVPFVDPSAELSPASLNAFRQTTRDPLHLDAAGHGWVARALLEPVRAALEP